MPDDLVREEISHNHKTSNQDGPPFEARDPVSSEVNLSPLQARPVRIFNRPNVTIVVSEVLENHSQLTLSQL